MGEAARKQDALARSEGSAITGTYHSAAAVDARLAAAQERFHLCSPFTAAGALPEGCGVQITLVQVDVDNETYDVGGGKLGLAKTALERVSHGIGISWDPELSRRLDDGRDPHYVHFKVVGRYRASDGQQQVVIGEKEMDLRDGSPQVEGLWDRYRASKAKFEAGKAKYAPKEPTAQIREMRLHILGHAETKARLRAIRSMGIRTSYAREELAKPFACARVVFTGRTEDPELRREFSKMTAASFLGGSRSLYGEPVSQPRALPPSGHAAPPVGTVRDEDDFVDVHPETGEVFEGRPTPATEPSQAAPASSSERRAPASRGGDAPVMKFGKSKGTPIDEADEDDLTWYAGALRKSVNDPEKSRFKAQNLSELEAVERELARRRDEELADPPSTDDEDDSWPDDRE